jgi:hypothetical protein
MSLKTTLLEPIPYHTELRNFLKEHESELWTWLASADAQAGYAAELRLDLLKSTYRLDPAVHVSLYEQAEKAKCALNLDIPVTIYQAQQTIGLNASLYYLPGEGHVVLTGNVLQLLKEDEILSVLAHELAHYHLWQCEGGEFHVMDRLVRTLAQNPRSTPSHLYTAKNAQLYTEIYCDRASWMATGDVSSMIRGLVKLQTGMADVHAESYLKQAEEVFQHKPGASEGSSHPETYIRAQALSLWVQDPVTAEEQIVAMIEGAKTVDELDLLGQKQMTRITHTLITDLLQPAWFQTSPILAHAGLFFPDFTVTGSPSISIPAFPHDAKTQEYLNYVLLDFAVMDPELEKEPLKQAIRIARRWDLEESFAKLAQKELKLKAKEWEKLCPAPEKRA